MMNRKGYLLLNILIGTMVFSTSALLISSVRQKIINATEALQMRSTFEVELRSVEKIIKSVGRRAYQCRKEVGGNGIECDIEQVFPPTGLPSNRRTVRFRSTPTGLVYAWKNTNNSGWVRKEFFPVVSGLSVCDCNDILVNRDCSVPPVSLNQIIITAGKCNANYFRFLITANAHGSHDIEKSVSGAFYTRNSLFNNGITFVFQ